MKEIAVILNLLIACEKLKNSVIMFNIILSNIIKLGSFKFCFNSTSQFKYSEFTILQDYWIATVYIQPEILFEATDFISKEVLLSLYRNENLYIEGYELWDHINSFGKAQNTELSEEI